MNERLVIGDLEFELERSARRKTIGVTLARDGHLVVHAPLEAEREDIERIARNKELWAHTKLAQRAEFGQYRPREFVTGEGFHYLGRSYRLKLISPTPQKSGIPALRLHQGRFLLRADVREQGRGQFIRWYREHARRWLKPRVEQLAERVDASTTGLVVRDLGNRWGSCYADQRIALHWRTILLPPRIIEYLIVHELCHLRVPNHSQKFWQCVERANSDFVSHKRWLAEHGAYYDL